MSLLFSYIYILLEIGFFVCPFVIVAMWFLFRKQITPAEQTSLPMREKVLIGLLFLASFLLSNMGNIVDLIK